MSELRFKYREGFCECYQDDYCGQCHTQASDALGCKFHDDGTRIIENGKVAIGLCGCLHAEFNYKIKCVKSTNYEVEYVVDVYNPHLNYIGLRIGKKYYKCTELFIDGVEQFKKDGGKE